jgi:hypothetical protein
MIFRHQILSTLSLTRHEFLFPLYKTSCVFHAYFTGYSSLLCLKNEAVEELIIETAEGKQASLETKMEAEKLYSMLS